MSVTQGRGSWLTGRVAVIAVPFAFLLVFFLFPLILYSRHI
jgi:hypothetical protein